LKQAAEGMANAIASRSFQVQKRELEYAFEVYMKEFVAREGFNESYQDYLEEGAEDFDRLRSEIQDEYERDIVTAAREFDVFDDVSDESLKELAVKIVGEAMKKEYKRTRGKIAESREFLKIIDRYQSSLTNIEEFIDMAGGAGDIGVLLGEKFSDKDIRVRIVDVVPVLEQYAGYLKEQGISSGMTERVKFELHPLQETVITEPSKTAIIAKHPCGGLKDDIVDIAIENGVPFLAIMTCCQDKMCDHADQYADKYVDETGANNRFKSKEEFIEVAKRSASTNIEVDEAPKKSQRKLQGKFDQGVEAMRRLDEITAERLKEAGYEVDIITIESDLVKKGDVIIARKIS
jgi:hypothetical protein